MDTKKAKAHTKNTSNVKVEKNYYEDKSIEERDDISREAFKLRKFRKEIYNMIQGDPEDLLWIDQR